MIDTQFEPLGIGVGTLIGGRYQIERSLGAGATSAVYRARDRALNNEVCALKILDPRMVADASDLERFRNEVVVTRKLTHPNIVRTFEFAKTAAGQYFITMEHVAGRTLRQLIYHAREELSFQSVLYYLKEILKGVAYAHDMGIVHRDLKPANILISDTGQVKITDFGLARPLELNAQFTQTGKCVGTPVYMAPEQVRGNPAVIQSDIYAVGVIAFEMVTGRLPFIAEDWVALAQKIIEQPLPKLSSPLHRFPGWFDDFVRKCTAKDPSERFATAHEAEKVLSSYMEETAALSVKLLPADAAHRTRSAITEMRTTFGFSISQHASAFLLIALLMVITIAAIGSPRPAPPAASQQKIAEQIQKSSQVINTFAVALERLNKAAIETQQNQAKINEFIKESEPAPPAAQPQTASASPTPIPSPAAGPVASPK